jgi:hypothetical protein
MGQGKVQGKRIRTAIVAGVVAAVVAATWLLASAERMSAASLKLAALLDIPSHNGRYRASMSPSQGGWTVQVRTPDGAVVDGALLALEGWMPDDSSVAPVRATKVESRGGGRYRVARMELDRAGWWNVRVQIASARGTDSLAFNFIR